MDPDPSDCIIVPPEYASGTWKSENAMEEDEDMEQDALNPVDLSILPSASAGADLDEHVPVPQYEDDAMEEDYPMEADEQDDDVSMQHSFLPSVDSSVGNDNLNPNMLKLLSLTDDMTTSKFGVGFSRSDVGRSVAAALLGYSLFCNIHREIYLKNAVAYMQIVETDRANRGKSDVQLPMDRMGRAVGRNQDSRVELVKTYLKVLDLRLAWNDELSIHANLQRLDDDPRGRFLFSLPNLLGFSLLLLTANRPDIPMHLGQEVCEALEAKLLDAGMVTVQRLRQHHKATGVKEKVMHKVLRRFKRKTAQIACFNLTRMVAPGISVSGMLSLTEFPPYNLFAPENISHFHVQYDRLLSVSATNEAPVTTTMLPVMERAASFVTPMYNNEITAYMQQRQGDAQKSTLDVPAFK
ncbi:hypothetical protein J8273_6837 [Carpediemonas membranifera]|uniref:Uncharacterized protein n=1 Tax=Carpediemonas membranifera TaxID=201153 RepID=A0A8J6E097_9EUKA|nr:hypothetical protein J8273_6837 [Carpediemonas membranifera]|eukprot:KAG9391883.1 hypothetical protein J8273_6837 [Carpediemonas membranifera]